MVISKHLLVQPQTDYQMLISRSDVNMVSREWVNWYDAQKRNMGRNGHSKHYTEVEHSDCV